LGKLAKSDSGTVLVYVLSAKWRRKETIICFSNVTLRSRYGTKWPFTLVFLINIFTVLQIVWSGGASKRSHGGSFPHYYFGPYGNGRINIFLRI